MFVYVMAIFVVNCRLILKRLVNFYSFFILFYTLFNNLIILVEKYMVNFIKT